jgi:hypothetical protein
MPNSYRITLKEWLPPHWAAWFEGMALSHSTEGYTLLDGPLPDQAALYGLIGKVRDLGLTLISIKALGEQAGQRVNNSVSAEADSPS